MSQPQDNNIGEKENIMLSVKEIIMASSAAVGIGIGVVNLVSNRKNKQAIAALEKKIPDVYTQNMWGGFNTPPQPTPVSNE